MTRFSLTLTFVVAICFVATAQSKLNFDSLLSANVHTFKGGSQFSGKGWNMLIEKSKRTNYVMIGEDHFIAEVPLFTQAFAAEYKPDNYICEMDKWMMEIFANKITRSTPAQLDEWVTANYNGFSFFQKRNEFAMMRALLNQKVSLHGIEQIGLTSTEIIYQHLVETGSVKNKKLYEVMRDSSKVTNARFISDMSKPFFMRTPMFNEWMANLDRASMTPGELAIVSALVRSAGIYETGSHRERIKLMQEHLMSLYPQTLKGKKNLFKFGANHTMKGESYIPVYDIGTTGNILAQAERQDSYHILILPRSGQQAGFISGAHDIDVSEGIFGSLRQYFDKSSATEWTMIDLEPIRNAIRRAGIDISDVMLRKTLMGYDALVVIPVATAAEAVRY